MDTDHAAAVALAKVWKVYDAPVLRDVSLEVDAGDVLAVLGPNGAGKSTLLRLIAGIARPTRGHLRVLGAEPAARRRSIGLAGHDTFLAGHLTTLENLQFFADLYSLPRARARAALEDIGLLHLARHPVRTLSRGTAQRVSLARSLLHDPAVVLLDEPFTGLDARAASDLTQHIGRLRGAGRCVVMTTHRVDEAVAVADTVAVLVGGRLVARERALHVDAGWLLDIYGSGAAKPETRSPKPVGSP